MNSNKYIYDYNVANALIQFGVKCVGTGCNKNKIYWIFKREECQPFYEHREEIKEKCHQTHKENENGYVKSESRNEI